MVWKVDNPQGNEAKKIVWEVAPFLRGQGLDLGAGDFKVMPHAVSVDNCHHNAFGYDIRPDIKVDTCEKLTVFASQSMDFVFSSHLLEHIENYKAALAEWWRVVKVGGYLVLYLPHKEFYPNVGQPGANPDHKHDFLPKDIISTMEGVSGGWDLVECQERNEDEEYSILLIFKRINGRQLFYSYRDKKPEKTALVCRFGAFGDLMQASSVIYGLKQQGYSVTLMCSPPGVDVMLHDPNIDNFMILDKDQVPNGNLPDFWRWQAKKYTKFVNLSESVEGTWLAMPGRTPHTWTPMVRHKHMNYNYLQFQHELAGVPHDPHVKFYPTKEEREWARKTRARMGNRIVMWSLAGSSVHKTWPYLDHIIASIMVNYEDVDVVLVGGPECAMLEAGWENEKRVHSTCGKWSIRQSLAFLYEADMVVGPETGVLNAAACMDIPKIMFLSHSTIENLTRDWVNTISFVSKGTRCKGRDSDDVTACHMLHFGWDHCTRGQVAGVAQCQEDISAGEVWSEVDKRLHAMGATLKEAA